MKSTNGHDFFELLAPAKHPESYEFQQELALLEELLRQRQYSDEAELELRIRKQFALVRSVKSSQTKATTAIERSLPGRDSEHSQEKY